MAHHQKAEELEYVELLPTDADNRFLENVRWLEGAITATRMRRDSDTPYINLPTSHNEPWASIFYGANGGTERQS